MYLQHIPVLAEVRVTCDLQQPLDFRLREISLEVEGYWSFPPAAAAPLSLIDIILEAVVRGLACTTCH
jgi:hypothetical protein